MENKKAIATVSPCAGAECCRCCCCCCLQRGTTSRGRTAARLCLVLIAGATLAASLVWTVPVCITVARRKTEEGDGILDGIVLAPVPVVFLLAAIIQIKQTLFNVLLSFDGISVPARSIAHVRTHQDDSGATTITADVAYDDPEGYSYAKRLDFQGYERLPPVDEVHLAVLPDAPWVCTKASDATRCSLALQICSSLLLSQATVATWTMNLVDLVRYASLAQWMIAWVVTVGCLACGYFGWAALIDETFLPKQPRELHQLAVLMLDSTPDRMIPLNVNQDITITGSSTTTTSSATAMATDEESEHLVDHSIILSP